MSGAYYPRHTERSYKEYLRDNKPDYRLVSKFSSVSKLCTFRHKSCGTEFEVRPNKFRSQLIPCPECRLVGGTNKVSTEESYSSFLESRWNGEYSLVSDFTCLTDKHEFVHNTCGTRFVSHPINLRKRRVPCPECQGIIKGTQYTTDEYKELLFRKHEGNYILLSDEYVDGKTLHLYKHTQCGTEFMSFPYKLRRKPIPCSECSSHGPGVAKRVRFFLGGQEFQLQGKEPTALPYVWKKVRCGIEELLTRKKDMPILWYRFKRDAHRYYPDVYIKSKNLLVEVKDMASLGFGKRSAFFGKDVFRRNCEKFLSAVAAGFEIKLVVVVYDKCITLPDDWYSYKKSELLSWIKLHT